MNNGKLKTLFLTILLTLCAANASFACEGLPKEVEQLLGEWEQAGVKTDCTVNQVANWAVKHNSGNPVSEAVKLLNAIGYENSPQIQTYGQASFDAWRKKENGVSTAFAAWKGSMATVVYEADKKNYTLIQYREFPKTASSGFNVKVTYDENSRFTAEDKKMINEAVGWWKDRIGDSFEITLEFYLDPSISAGGTTLVGDVPRSCIDHQPGYAEIKLKEVNTSLVSHEIGHALGIGTAAVFKSNNVCSTLAKMSKDIPDISVSNARIEGNKFFGNISKGVLLWKDSDGDYSHVSSEAKDEDGNHSAVQPSLGGKPSLLDLRILEDLGYEIK